MNHFSLKIFDNEIKSSNLSEECKTCYIQCHTKGTLINECPKYGGKRRQGKITTNKSETFLCCEKTKTTKLFRDKLEGLSYAYLDLELPSKEIEESYKLLSQKRVNRLVHNLTSINAQAIQEIYNFVPQEILTRDISKQVEILKDEITSNSKDAALLFIRMAKHNMKMKSEFSVYKKLERANPKLNKESHPIHKVLMNVLHSFFVDLSDRDIFVDVGSFKERILCDYESIQVAIYHIIENCTKYVKPKSKMNISFDSDNNKVFMEINMTSLYISDSELDKIFEEGNSGEEAIRSGKAGEGIGLWRVKQMLELNESDIKIINGKEKENVIGFKFADNTIIMSFPKAKN